MKKIVISVLSIFLLSFWVSAYTPSSELQRSMDQAVDAIEAVIDTKGEGYRNNFVEAIQSYQEQYIDHERNSYILSYLLDAISGNAITPNILLIVADDMGLDATPGFSEGSVKPNMPNLESMIEEGIRYTNLWSAPVCTPTRGTIMSGKYGYHTNVLAVDDVLDTGEMGLQEFIDKETNSSYDHAVIGKWHIGSESGHPEATGVGYYAGMQSGGVQSYYDWRFVQNASKRKNNEYITSKFTDLAIDWIDEREKPWFLWLAYTAPHTPFHLPPIELHSQGGLPDDEDSISTNPLPYYMAAIEAMDSEIGRLLDSIPESERENTTIIFIGDNGTPGQVAQFPYERRKAKGSLYEGGINVPMIVSGYGVNRYGEIDERLVNTSDLYATIADIAGIHIDSIHNSYSFRESFTMPGTQDRDYVYSELGGKGYTVKDANYKLIVFENGNREMYDIVNDPYETIDLLKTSLTSSQSLAKTTLEEYLLKIRN